MAEKNILIIEKRRVVALGLYKILNDDHNYNIFFEESYSLNSPQNSENLAGMDVVILGQFGCSIIDTIKEIKCEDKNVEILVLAEILRYPGDANILLAGAKGFLLQNCQREELITALNNLFLHRNYWCRPMLEKLATETYNKNLRRKKKKSELINSLSPKKQNIVELLIEGLSVSMISKKLGLKISTISTHKRIIFEKLSVTSLVELIELMHGQ